MDDVSLQLYCMILKFLINGIILFLLPGSKISSVLKKFLIFSIYFLDLRRYVVIKFIDQIKDIVPKIWLLKNGQECYWPSFKNDRTRKVYYSAVEKEISPKGKWKHYKVEKILGSAGKFTFLQFLLRGTKFYEQRCFSSNNRKFSRT